MKFKEYKQLDLVGFGEEILQYWEKNKVFEQSVTNREGKTPFVFYEGPPSANGKPGIHHVMARTIKDMFCRYQTLKGKQVKRKAGWDTHGLPVELQVEKELGITKEDIGQSISVEEYNQKCRETVMKFTGLWNELTVKMGYWVDLDDPYITYKPEYVESLWALLAMLHKKGLLYKGYTIQPYSPAAGTGLSSHELNLPGCYREVKDTSIVAQFKLNPSEGFSKLFGEGAPVYILAWTTTPWTLPANSALAVGEKIKYAVVNTFNPYTFEPSRVVLAEELVPRYFSEKQRKASVADYKQGDKLIPMEVVQTVSGKELVGLSYEQLLPYVQPKGKAFEVIAGDFVSTEDGTGIVHISPTFGADDLRVAQAAGISAITVQDETGKEMPLVDKQGKFVQEVTDFAGRYVKEEYYDSETLAQPDFKPTDVLIAIKLKEENKAFKVEKYEHSYPHCWRTDRPVLYYPLDSWFIRTTAMKERLVELNNTINWKPAATGTGRFGNWLENLVDWNLSRSRYWGTPLPIWRTEDGQEEICIGSLQQLRDEVGKAVEKGLMLENPLENTEAEFDPHRPFVDDIILVSASGKPMYREPDLIDVWFDSGAMPYAQWHYPIENQEKFEQRFPADFISEGVDQTRGWFFTLHAIAGMLFDSVAFKNVVSNGLVLDANGNKMSKRLGNAVDPFQTIEQHGADAVRWYMMANANPWENLKFNADGLKEVQRKFFGTLYNTYSFFALYANLDSFRYDGEPLPLSKRDESDRWIISKLNSLIKAVDGAYADYEPTKAARLVQGFTTDDLSNWYVRLNRKRFWRGELNTDKLAAYQTLYECLVSIAKLMSPIAPFYADRLYQDLNGVTGHEQATSVHLTDFPVADETRIAQDLEEQMHYAQSISSLVHSLRRKESLKVRQPLQRILIPDLNERLTERIKAVEAIIKAEVNIKTVEFIDDSSGILVKNIKPNFRKLGQQYGKLVKDIAGTIKAFEAEQIKLLEQEGSYQIEVQGQQIMLTLEDVEVTSEDIPGWSVAKDGNLTVALDVTLTEALKQEGLAREMVNRIQNLRKNAGLEVQDKIHLQIKKADTLFNAAIEAYQGYICRETQALSLILADDLQGEVTVLELDELQVALGMRVEK